MNFEVYRKSPLTSFGEQWQWRLRTSNGQVVATGTSYPDIATCMRAIVLVKKNGLAARVVNPENGLTFVGVDHESGLIGYPQSGPTPSPSLGVGRAGDHGEWLGSDRRAAGAARPRDPA